MSKYHTPSLTFSIVVHVVAVLIFVLIYKSANSLINKVEKEKRVCLILNICMPKMEEIPQKVVKVQKKELQKRVTRVTRVKIPKKIKAQKKIKTVVKKKVPIVQKRVEEKIQEVVVKKVISKKEEEIPKIIAQTVQKTSIVQPVEEPVILPQKTNQEKYIDNHLQKISQLLSENLYYPRRARKRGVTGKVIVKFNLSNKAIVNNIEVVKSQSELLSRAAIKTIQNLSGKFPKPDENIVLQVPIVFSLK